MKKVLFGVAAAAVAVLAVASPPQREATLALRPGAVWWRAGNAPTQWAEADERVLGAVQWRTGQTGVVSVTHEVDRTKIIEA